jgi:hypothetical protein
MTTRLVLAVDPGKATGICLFLYENVEPELLWSGEYQADEFANAVRSAIIEAQGRGVQLETTCERFTITAQTAKNSQAPYSLEQIGVLKHLIRESNGVAGELVFQAPVDAKRLFPNEALKKLEYWHKGGEGHALDAIRHGLLYLAKHGWTPKRLLQ